MQERPALRSRVAAQPRFPKRAGTKAPGNSRSADPARKQRTPSAAACMPCGWSARVLRRFGVIQTSLDPAPSCSRCKSTVARGKEQVPASRVLLPEIRVNNRCYRICPKKQHGMRGISRAHQRRWRVVVSSGWFQKLRTMSFRTRLRLPLSCRCFRMRAAGNLTKSCADFQGTVPPRSLCCRRGPSFRRWVRTRSLVWHRASWRRHWQVLKRMSFVRPPFSLPLTKSSHS